MRNASAGLILLIIAGIMNQTGAKETMTAITTFSLQLGVDHHKTTF
jgi:hypothetical protein